MTEQGNRYQRIRAILCAECPIRTTCPQFAEQMDACADALLIQAEDMMELPGSLTQFLATFQDEEEMG